MSSKRTNETTGNTPGKPKKKQPKKAISTRRSLFDSKEEQSSVVESGWAVNEVKGLVQFIALFHETNDDKREWPAHKRERFWSKCAEAVQKFSGEPLRTKWACRSKVVRELRTCFRTIDDAEEAYNIDYFVDKVEAPVIESTPKSSCQKVCGLSPVFSCSPTSGPVRHKAPADVIGSIFESFHTVLTKKQREQLLQQLFTTFVNNDVNKKIPMEYISKELTSLIGRGINVLYENNKENLFLYMGKCFGSTDENDLTRMPMDRMPFGLISHNLKFFSLDNAGTLQAPDDYKSWMETMYARFGQSWAALHLGPMWSYVESTKENTKDIPDVLTVALQESGLSSICSEDGYQSTTSPINQSTCLDYLHSAQNKTSSPCPPNSTDPSASTSSINTEHSTCAPATATGSTTRKSYSTLWANVTKEQAEELKDADATLRELEERFSVRPNRHSGVSHAVPKKPAMAKVNIAGPSAVSIRRNIANSGFTKTTDIQMKALKTAHENNKKGRWWIKADATDVNKGLRESVQNKWSGDVDLGDKTLQQLHKEYLEKLQFVERIGLKNRNSNSKIMEDFESLQVTLKKDEDFLNQGFLESQELYNRHLKRSNVSEQSLFALAWDVDGFEKLLIKNKKIKEELYTITKRFAQKEGNLPKDLKNLRVDLALYTRGIYGKKREAASHLLVFMISDELRLYKPYAIPVRVVTYKTITDDKVQSLKNELKEAMTGIGMKVIGFATDGEWNKLRTQGSGRPISIIQLMMDAKEEAKRTPVRLIDQYLRPVMRNPARPIRLHNAIPLEDVQWLSDFMNDNNVPFERAIHILRRTHYPFHYDPHPWVNGKVETKTDCLKSLMSRYLYRAMIEDHVANGVNFKDHLFVSEVNEVTKEPEYQREDHNHVLKRITSCLREGVIPGVDLRFFVDALNDPHTGLTYTALTGQRKQSVPDCERVFSRGVLQFMIDNGHDAEAEFIKIIRNWHKASDGRGLDDAARSHHNKEMLNWILSDWMPWFTYDRDYSTMDVNRPIKGIQGLTRELIVAIIANIESQEHRRQDGSRRGLAVEHPRASSTDDVEGFFSIVHAMLGQSFDLKTFFDQYPKILNEFYKRIDPDTPFYYWSSKNERYHLGPLKSFNQPSEEEERLDRIVVSRRSDPGVFVANRASLPQRGHLSVRAEWHRAPECLPPPRAQQN